MAVPVNSTTNGNPSEQEFWGGSPEWSTKQGSAELSESYNPRLSLLGECKAMIRYGSTLGISLPGNALNIVDRARMAVAGTPATTPHSDEDEHPNAGPPPSPPAKKDDPRISLSTLADAHRQLAAAVAPATPSTIQLLADEQTRGFGRYFGATRYARGLSAIAVLAFVAFVLLQGLNSPRWLEIVITALASIIGGIFYSLFALSRQLARGSFNRNLEGQYTILIILGGLAGTALAFLIVQPQNPGTTTPDPATIDVFLTRPLLALLGGFSARAVYRILERLVGSVEALVRGSGDEMVAAQEQAAQARAAAETVQAKAETVRSLLDINAKVTAAKADGGVQAEINKLISKLLADLPPAATSQPQSGPVT